MKLNTTSYLAGVGSVVAVLSTGFAGGYFLVNPARMDPPNRLQRLAAENQSPRAAAPAATVTKPETVAAVTPVESSVTTPTPASPTVAAPTTVPATPVAQPVTEQPAPPATVPPVEAKAPEPARNTVAQQTSAPAVAERVDVDKVPAQKASADQARGVEANSAERKRSEARKETRKIGEQKVAEQQRKQRELEVATVAVRRIIHDRDPPDIRDAQDIVEVDQPEAPPPEMPHFRLFGR